jgi:hypothetical protein
LLDRKESPKKFCITNRFQFTSIDNDPSGLSFSITSKITFSWNSLAIFESNEFRNLITNLESSFLCLKLDLFQYSIISGVPCSSWLLK